MTARGRSSCGRKKICKHARLRQSALNPPFLEAFVPFEREISVIAARNEQGQTVSYDIAENVHRNQILHTSTVPADIDERNSSQCPCDRRDGRKSALDYVGVLAVELFLLPEGHEERLVANEMAPRVHNSGHWTESACLISQFEQHIRAIAGWPLGETRRHSNCVMTNLIGSDIDQWPDQLASPGQTVFHSYGKGRDARRAQDGARQCHNPHQQGLISVFFAVFPENRTDAYGQDCTGLVERLKVSGAATAVTDFFY